ncbi:MAG: hypothetical protein OEZ06_16720 [Myxococcales bacterium]|nr:hypothetical protein [Myxococcales bacterium]
MPQMQTMFAELNQYTTPEGMLKLKGQAKGGQAPTELRQRITAGRGRADFAKAIEAWPSGIRAMMRALINDNLEREVPLGMTWMWKPAKDYEIQVWEVADSATTHGGISVLLGSPFPMEDHPVDIGKPAHAVSPATKLARAMRRKVVAKRVIKSATQKGEKKGPRKATKKRRSV